MKYYFSILDKIRNKIKLEGNVLRYTQIEIKSDNCSLIISKMELY